MCPITTTGDYWALLTSHHALLCIVQHVVRGEKTEEFKKIEKGKAVNTKAVTGTLCPYTYLEPMAFKLSDGKL